MGSSIAACSQTSTTATFYPFQMQRYCQVLKGVLFPKDWLAFRNVWMNPTLLKMYVLYTGNPHAFSVPNLLVPSFIQQMWSAYFVSDILLHFENISVWKTDKAYNLVKGD